MTARAPTPMPEGVVRPPAPATPPKNGKVTDCHSMGVSVQSFDRSFTILSVYYVGDVLCIDVE